MANETRSLIRCVGCGTPLGGAGEPPSPGAIDHIRTCKGHPLGDELRRTREALAEALGAILGAGLQSPAATRALALAQKLQR